MYIVFWKILIMLGLGMTFGGLITMMEARMIKMGDKTFTGHTVQKPTLYKISWGLTILGYLLQIFGVIIT
jgi:hypothetical protein